MSANWIISANNAIYDHSASFKENGYIDWHQVANFAIGDFVYIYCTAPLKRIKYKTVVVRVGMKFSEVTNDRKHWKSIDRFEKAQKDNYCRLVLIEEIFTDNLVLEKLLLNGLSSAPQGPQRIKPQLDEYIQKEFTHNSRIFFSTSQIEFEEGTEKIKHHIVRERSQELIHKAKELFKTKHSGNIYCEICGFDFSKKYGPFGEGFIEVHHTKPVSKMKPGEKTSILDLIMVCSNCHSMIHRKKHWLTKEELKSLIID